MPMINSDNLINRFCSECEFEESCIKHGKDECDVYLNIMAEVESQQETDKETLYGEDW